jgi:hypothetical protein
LFHPHFLLEFFAPTRQFPKDWVEKLRELKGFRHVMRHAYDITLRPAASMILPLAKLVHETGIPVTEQYPLSDPNVRPGRC